MNNAKRLIIVLLSSLVASQAVAWSGLTYSVKVIDIPGSTTTSVKSINDRGQVVGTYYDGSRHLSFIYRGGKFKTLDFPNSIETTAYSINDRGQVAGEYWNGGSNVKSFVYSGGEFETLNIPGYNAAFGINDRGQMTGFMKKRGLMNSSTVIIHLLPSIFLARFSLADSVFMLRDRWLVLTLLAHVIMVLCTTTKTVFLRLLISRILLKPQPIALTLANK